MKDVWNAMSDKTRREILNLLKEGDMTAGEICARFTTSGATISHHLSVLKDANLVFCEKKAQTITYSLNITVFQSLIKSLAEILNNKGDNK